jgi:hypothetical protein
MACFVLAANHVALWSANSPLRLRSKAPEEIRFSSDDVLWIKGLQNLVYYKPLVTIEGAHLQIPSVFGKVTRLGIFVLVRVGRRDVLFPIFHG